MRLTLPQTARIIRNCAVTRRVSFANEERVLAAYLSPLLRSGPLLGLFVVLLGRGAWGEEARLSISGYDPVAYFTDGQPVLGKTEFEYAWRDARWRLPALRIGIFSSRIPSITRRNTTATARWV